MLTVNDNIITLWAMLPLYRLPLLFGDHHVTSGGILQLLVT